jgi:Zn-dependent protease
MNFFINKLFEDPLYFVRHVVILIISIVLHELAHGFAALSQGDDTPKKMGHITLNPIIHMGVPSLVMLCLAGITWGQMPVNPTQFRYRWSDAWVAAAGPLSNLALAGSGCIVMALVKVHAINSVSLEFFGMLAYINVFLFLFNLLPVPPLDGFTVLSGLMPSLKSVRNSSVGLFMMVVIFTVPAVQQGLAALAQLSVMGFTQLLIDLTAR